MCFCHDLAFLFCGEEMGLLAELRSTPTSVCRRRRDACGMDCCGQLSYIQSAGVQSEPLRLRETSARLVRTPPEPKPPPPLPGESSTARLPEASGRTPSPAAPRSRPASAGRRDRSASSRIARIRAIRNPVSRHVGHFPWSGELCPLSRTPSSFQPLCELGVSRDQSEDCGPIALSQCTLGCLLRSVQYAPQCAASGARLRLGITFYGAARRGAAQRGLTARGSRDRAGVARGTASGALGRRARAAGRPSRSRAATERSPGRPSADFSAEISSKILQARILWGCPLICEGNPPLKSSCSDQRLR